MGLFGAASGFDEAVERATSENNTSEKWDLIMEICDKIGNSSVNAKECLRSIIRRLNHTDPHVVVQAITLLDACVSNCGKSFHLEVASRDFETEFKKLINKTQSVEITTKLKLCLKRWADNEFKSDPQLNLIPSLFQRLKSEGHDFSEHSKPVKREVVSKDPNVVSSQQEEDDIAKAIELSLKEAKISSPKSLGASRTSVAAAAASSLYPSMDLGSGAVANSVSEPRKVRALYDFEAAEDNELTFFSGEIVLVLDDSDPNWWKGQNARGEGLFPANFVSADLSAEPESLKAESSKKSTVTKTVQFEQDLVKEEPAQINEDTIDRLLHLLHEADPEDPSQDTDEMLRLENMVNQMGPLIDSELDRVDRKHGQLSQLSADFAEAVTLYHSLMRDGRFPMHAMAPPPHMAAPYTPYSYSQYAPGPASFVQNGLPNGSPMHHPHANFAPPTGAFNHFPHGLQGPQTAPGPAPGPQQFAPIQNFQAPGPQSFAPPPQSQPAPPQNTFTPISPPQQAPPPQNMQPQQPPQMLYHQPAFSHQSPNHQPQYQGQVNPQFNPHPQATPGNIPIYQQR